MYQPPLLEQESQQFSQIFSRYPQYGNTLRQLNTNIRLADQSRFPREDCSLRPSAQEVKDYFNIQQDMVMFEVFDAVTDEAIMSNISTTYMHRSSNNKAKVLCSYVSYGYEDFSPYPILWIDNYTDFSTFDDQSGKFADGAIVDDEDDVPLTLVQYMSIDDYSRFPKYGRLTWRKTGDGTVEYAGSIRYFADVVSEYNILR